MLSILSIFSRSKDISLSDYNKFLDTGIVSKSILEKIAKKIIKNEKLEHNETTVFASKVSEINEIILRIHKSSS